MLNNSFFFAEYYGITESEAKEAMNAYQLGKGIRAAGLESDDESLIESHMKKQIEKYYGKYQIPGFPEKLYNTESFYKALTSIDGNKAILNNRKISI